MRSANVELGGVDEFAVHGDSGVASWSTACCRVFCWLAGTSSSLSRTPSLEPALRLSEATTWPRATCSTWTVPPVIFANWVVRSKELPGESSPALHLLPPLFGHTSQISSPWFNFNLASLHNWPLLVTICHRITGSSRRPVTHAVPGQATRRDTPHFVPLGGTIEGADGPSADD